MKPIHLEMTNFGPYRQEVIDFSALEDSNLFLISGRTGAGKSSIFDAMTYALYDETSSDRSIHELRSTFASIQDARTKVVFHFEHHNQLYRVERELDLKPQLKIDRGKGINTKKASLSVVERVDGLELSKLASKTKDVTAAVIELLGLTASQFKQIILLPQYQFSQFLKSPTKDKVPILRQIFGTQIFADFEQKLAQRWTEAKKEQDNFQTTFETYFTSPLWSEKEKTAFEHQSQAEKISLARQFLEEHAASLASLKTFESQKQALAEKAALTYQDGLALDKQFKEQELLQERYQKEVVNQKQEATVKENQIAQLEFAAGLADVVKQLNSKQTAVVQLEASINHLKEELDEQESALTPLEETLTALEKEEIEQEAAHDSLTELNVALNSARSLSKQESLKKSLEAERQAIKQQRLDLEKQVQNLEEQKSVLQSQTIAQESIEQAKDLVNWVSHVVKERLDKSLTQLEASQQRQAELKSDLACIEENCQTWEAQLEADSLELDAKKKDRRELMIAQLQSELSDGEPCPVCGALEHPNVTAEMVDTVKLKGLLEAIEELESQMSQTSKKLQEARLRQETLQASYEQEALSIETYQSELSAVFEELLQKVSAILPKLTETASYSFERGETILQAVQKHLKDQEVLKSAQEEQAATLAQEDERLSKALQDLERHSAHLDGQLSSVKQEIDTLKTTHPQLETVAFYEEKIDKISQTYEAFKARLADYQKKVATGKENRSRLVGTLSTQEEHLKQEKLEKDRLSKALNQALEDDNALTNRLDELENWIDQEESGALKQAQTWLARYEQNRETLQEEVNRLHQALENKERPDLDDLSHQKKLAEEEATKAAKELAVAKREYEHLAQLVSDIEAQSKENRQQLATFNQLSQLRNIVSGQESGQKRLKLETYVIQEYLEEILTYANNHYIGLLSNQQFEFLIAKDSSGNAQSGLDINIFDRANNKELPASSLSGGETFIASLAIALSLSEVVQNASNGALVETLFIDEGFGSLDEDTLDKAIAVLEKIGQNRMVGVISHVKEMKENIQQQLLIEKSLDGSSQISLVV